MDDFLSGLHGRLRVSGMLADSIMMGIVNSAMENAYRKSCSREGILVRLNEKSRFCELAIMQLEWCLKFLQEETEYTNLLESNYDREKLLSDLLETRDRIHNRLMETELMIEEKDRELSERMEIESNLRVALEVKDEDITSLNTALGLERERSKRSKKSMEKIGGSGFGDVKSCVDEQIQKIRSKLEDGQHNLKSLIRRLSSRSMDLDRLISEFDGNGEEGGLTDPKDMNSKLMLEKVETLNLEIEFKEMGIDMDILKEKIDSSFKVMASSVSLFKKILDEQHWVLDFEKETVFLLVRGLLGEVECKFSGDHVCGKSGRSNGGASGRAEVASSISKKLDNAEELSLESPSCRSVAQKIKSHEFIIKKKAQEIDSLKGEKSKDKGSMSLKSERSLDTVKEMITRFNTSVECIAKEKSKLAACSDDLKGKDGGEKNFLPKNCLSESVVGENESKSVQPVKEIARQSSNCSYCHLIHAELSEMVEQLRQEKEDMQIESIIFEDIYATIFTDFVRRLHLDCIEHDIDAQIRDDTYRTIFSVMIKEWINNIETCNVERLFMEETYHHALNEVVKDIIYAAILTARNSYEQDLSFRNCLFQSSQINNTMQQLDVLFAENLERNYSLGSAELDSHLDLVPSELEESNEQDDAFISVFGRSEKVLQQLNSGEIQAEESLSIIDLPPDDEDAPAICSIQESKYHVALAPDSIQDAKDTRCLPRDQEERQWSEFQFIMMLLTEFSQKIVDFEVIACGKIRTDITRFEDLNRCIAPLIEQLNSIKKQEGLYRKAFTRRCYDLQIAEAEVDLLGDEVDILYALIEKIYKVLNHCAPALQHCHGIMDILIMMRKQLHGCTAS